MRTANVSDEPFNCRRFKKECTSICRRF